jgi:hypothetical protein
LHSLHHPFAGAECAVAGIAMLHTPIMAHDASGGGDSEAAVLPPPAGSFSTEEHGRQTVVFDEAWAQQCPRDFWLTRIWAKILRSRWVIPALISIGGGASGLLKGFCPQYAKGFEACSVADAHPLLLIDKTLESLGVCVVGFTLFSLRTVTSPDNGTLFRLGAGRKMIGAPPNDQQCGATMPSMLLHHLACWARLLCVVAMWFFLWGCEYVVGNGIDLIRFAITGDVEINWYHAMVDFFEGFYYMTSTGLAAWWLTLKMGAALVRHQVLKTWNDVERLDAASPEWASRIDPAVTTLIKKTLPLLSGGWQSGVTAMCLGCWAWSAASIVAGIHEEDSGLFLRAFVFALVPVLVLWDLAEVSTQCDNLVAGLSYKRVIDPSDVTHLKVAKLEMMLTHLNKVRHRTIRQLCVLLLGINFSCRSFA